LLKKADLAQATNYYREANRLDPREAVILVSLAESSCAPGECEIQQQSTLLPPLTLKADFADAHVLLARLLARTGENI